MAEKDNTDNNFINNIGSYVVKVGGLFVTKYRYPFLSLTKTIPDEVSIYLRDVQDFIKDEKMAKEIADKYNGKVYKICVEPVEGND